MKKQTGQKNNGTDRIGKTVYWLYIIFLVLCFILIGRLACIQMFFTPDQKILEAMTPTSTKRTIEPARGAIMACDGRILAISAPSFNIYMDCSVMRDEFRKDKEHGAAREAEWMKKAEALSRGLARNLKDKSAQEYFQIIKNGRAHGRKYVPVCKDIDLTMFDSLSALPLFNEPRFKGGMIEERENIRKYPYGSLARRTIGFVRNNRSTVRNTHIGIEGKYDHYLHGVEGHEWLKTVDMKRKVRDFDSTYVSSEDGLDVVTTLDIDLQDVADKALRSQIEDDLEIEGGCAIVMDVRTGAIRAMVNLLRDSTTRRLEESQNLAISRLGEPGSVFKSTNLMTQLEDGRIKSVGEMMPTNGGRLAPFAQDSYITNWERNHHTKQISIIDGFAISSNYVFRKLATDNYGRKPQDYIDKLYLYKLGEAFDFDLEGMATPVIPSPKSKLWSATDLGSVAIGYAVSETPLHILTFYNAIAGKGRMMKPYLIERIERSGITVKQMGPSILNASICSKATADTITRALRAVVEKPYGTGKRLHSPDYTFAGKTGTARVALEQGGYEIYGRKKHQGTFVGFFPADDPADPDAKAPAYSMIVTVYSVLTDRNFYGGAKPAETARIIADYLHNADPCWEGTIQQKKGRLAPMSDPTSDRLVAASGDKDETIVPDLKGLGLRDALYVVENAGLRCEYSGVGHVSEQSIPKGQKAKRGSTITIRLN